MTRETELVQLEHHIERLLQACAALREENRTLNDNLRQTRDENAGLLSRIETMELERSDVRSRVGSLIDRIERWEAAADEEDAVALSGAEPDGSTPVMYASGDSGEDDGSAYEGRDPGWETEARGEEEAQKSKDRDGGVQGSLFSR